MKRFLGEPLLDVRDWLAQSVAGGETCVFEVPDPALGGGRYAGETVEVTGRRARHRPLRCWVELAEALGCRVMVQPEGDVEPGFLRLAVQPLARDEAFHGAEPGDPTEKYGVDSVYARIDKREEPSFVLALEHALQRVPLTPGQRVLDLGVNRGDELALLQRVMGPETFDSLEVVGVDHSASAVTVARERFASPSVQLHVHDINDLEALGLGRFDLLLSVGTLHSPSIRSSKELVMHLVQAHLTPGGAVVLGFPNCRYRDGEVLHGARAPNYNFPEQSLVLKDVDWCKRYLQQHRFRVTITGRLYLFVAATRI